MLRVKIAGKRFRIPTHWEDITLTQCAWLYHKANEQPTALLDYYRSFASDTAPEPYANIDELTRFTSEVVGYLADVPEGLMLQTRREDIMTLAMAVLPRFIIGYSALSIIRFGALLHFATKAAATTCRNPGRIFPGNLLR